MRSPLYWSRKRGACRLAHRWMDCVVLGVVVVATAVGRVVAVFDLGVVPQSDLTAAKLSTKQL